MTKGKHMATKTYRLARTFCEDHWERDCGQTDTVLRVTERFVTVTLDDEGYADMLSDADYYWSCRDQFDGYSAIIASASRVLDALRKQGPPE
jgi:hypothetical protein